MKKHENAISVSKTNYISNKWLDNADGVDIPQDRVHKHQVMVFCHKEETFDQKNCTSHIRATYRKTNEVKFYDMAYNFEREDVNDQNYIPATSEMILHVTKWFWFSKLKLEIENDGIHTNEYLYGNTGYSWLTPETIISAFYKAQMHMVNTYKEKEHM